MQRVRLATSSIFIAHLRTDRATLASFTPGPFGECRFKAASAGLLRRPILFHTSPHRRGHQPSCTHAGAVAVIVGPWVVLRRVANSLWKSRGGEGLRADHDHGTLGAARRWCGAGQGLLPPDDWRRGRPRVGAQASKRCPTHFDTVYSSGDWNLSAGSMRPIGRRSPPKVSALNRRSSTIARCKDSRSILCWHDHRQRWNHRMAALNGVSMTNGY